MMGVTIDLPNKDDFVKDYNSMKIIEVANKYNVSTCTIRKWAKYFQLSSKKASINIKEGDVIGSWRILYKDKMNKYGSLRWKVQCVQCNKLGTKTTGHIVASSKLGYSCGCNKYTGHKHLSGKYWKQVLYHARNRGIAVDINIIDAWLQYEKQNKICILSKLAIHFGIDQTASLDRIDSKLPYTISNIQWVHKSINIMKNKLSQQEFVRLCKLVAEYN
jgi:hypothetical protein